MSQKPKSNARQRTAQVGVRMLPAERREAQQLADANGQTVPAFLRGLLLQELQTPTTSPARAGTDQTAAARDPGPANYEAAPDGSLPPVSRGGRAAGSHPPPASAGAA
jgi:hypothetical protein